MERCYVKKLCEDVDNDYGVDQNLSMYIKKKDNIAWEVFYENRLLLKNEKNKNVKIIYKHRLNSNGKWYMDSICRRSSSTKNI